MFNIVRFESPLALAENISDAELSFDESVGEAAVNQRDTSVVIIEDSEDEEQPEPAAKMQTKQEKKEAIKRAEKEFHRQVDRHNLQLKKEVRIFSF